jgi:hypothetical protein
MNTVRIANVIQSYLVEPEGTLYKKELRDVIFSNEKYKQILEEQVQVKNTLQQVSIPEIPINLEESVNLQLKNSLQNTGMNILSANINFALLTLSVLSALTLIAFSLYKYSNSQKIENKVFTINSEVQNIKIQNAKLDSLSYDYWSSGHKSVNANQIQELTLREDDIINYIRANISSDRLIGYIGDVNQYYDITNIDSAMLGENILSKAKQKMLNENNDVDSITSLLEKASILTHKVRTVKSEK